MSSIVTPKGNQVVPERVLKLLRPLDFTSMYDLGNKKTDGVPYGVYFRGVGIKYDSIDLNGLDGTLRLDLRTRLNLEPRDLVANIGTSEHVLEQEPVFENVHRLSSSRMVHMVPRMYSWPGHGYWEYTMRFFEILATDNAYFIEKMYVDDFYTAICCSLRKTDDRTFIWRKGILYHLRRKKGRGGVAYR